METELTKINEVQASIKGTLNIKERNLKRKQEMISKNEKVTVLQNEEDDNGDIVEVKKQVPAYAGEGLKEATPSLSVKERNLQNKEAAKEHADKEGEEEIKSSSKESGKGKGKKA